MSQCSERTSAVLSLVSPLWGGGGGGLSSTFDSFCLKSLSNVLEFSASTLQR